MTVERIKEIRDCLTDKNAEDFEAILDECINNPQLDYIPLIIVSLTENSERMWLIENFHRILDNYIVENPSEAIPVILNNVGLAIPDGVPYIGISINGILSEDKEYEIFLNSLELNSTNKEALINILNHNIDDYKHSEKHNLLLDIEISKIRHERANHILNILSI